MIASSKKCPTTGIPDSHHKRIFAGNLVPEQQGPLFQVLLVPNPRLDVHITLHVDQGTRPGPPDLPRRDLYLLNRLCG